MVFKKVPFPYERKSKRNSGASITKTIEPVIAEAQPKADRKKKEKIEAPIISRISKTNNDIQMRLVSRIPVDGQLAIYDQMTKTGMSPNKTIRSLWKRDFAKFEAALSEATSTEQVQFGKLAVETTRKVSIQFYQKAKLKYDPFGILSERALGQKIGEAILILSGKEETNDG